QPGLRTVGHPSRAQRQKRQEHAAPAPQSRVPAPRGNLPFCARGHQPHSRPGSERRCLALCLP
ncbi:hypothetical protein P7K49_025259, partial [Saguinus oedipus]